MSTAVSIFLFLIYKGGLKRSYTDVMSAVDDFFDQWNPNTATMIKEMHGGNVEI